tara:strand:+ start:385 stop:582 length:198 start_codon:yes stop_codon:yes gene_type:complete
VLGKRNPQSTQMVGIPNAGQHQQLRRVDASSRDQDLSGRVSAMDITGPLVLDSDNTPISDEQPTH